MNEYKVAIEYSIFTDHHNGQMSQQTAQIIIQLRTTVPEPRIPARSIGTTTILINLSVCLLLQMGLCPGQPHA